MRNQEKVLDLRIHEGSAGYGVYIMILEYLRDQTNYRVKYKQDHIAFALNEQNVQLVERVCNDYGLFEIDQDGCIYSQWLIDSMTSLENKKERYSKAASKAASERWKGEKSDNSQKCDRNAIAMPSQCDGNAIALQPQCDGNANIYNIINKTKESTQATRVWEVTEKLKLSIEELGKIAREIEEKITKSTKLFPEPSSDYDHNGRLIAEIAVHFRLTKNQYRTLLIITQYGLLESREFKELLMLYKKCKKDGFEPKYPFNYILMNFTAYKKIVTEDERG